MLLIDPNKADRRSTWYLIVCRLQCSLYITNWNLLLWLSLWLPFCDSFELIQIQSYRSSHTDLVIRTQLLLEPHDHTVVCRPLKRFSVKTEQMKLICWFAALLSLSDAERSSARIAWNVHWNWNEHQRIEFRLSDSTENAHKNEIKMQN